MADETLSVDDEVLSIEDVAVVLGVHYMTAYRYVKRRSDRHSKAEGSQDARRTADYHRELERCLVNSDAKAAFEVIQAAIDAGADMEEVYLDILGQIGRAHV